MTGVLTRTRPAAPPPALVASLPPVLVAAGVLLSYVVYALLQNDVPPPERAGLPVLAHWDGEWYLDIAQFGYGEGGRTNPDFRAEFFPLFPGLAAAVHALLPFVPLDVAGSALNIGLVLAGVALVDRVALAAGWPTAHRCLLALFVVTVPNAFFFVCFYGEALLAFCAALVLWGLRSDRLLVAAVGAALACVTRPVGFLLAVPVALTALRRPTAATSWAAGGIVAAGMGTLFLTYQLLAGSPIAFVHAQFDNPEWRDWALGRYGWSGAWRTVKDAFVGPGFESLGSSPIGVGVLVLVLVFAGLAWRWDWRFSVGAFAMILGPLWFQPLSALARYLVPTWFAWVGGFATLRRSRAGLAAVGVLCALGLAANFHLLDRFARWSFVG